MDSHYDYTPFARELFWDMEKSGYITFTKNDAYKTILNYLSNPIDFKSKQIRKLYQFKKYFCEGEFFNLREFSDFLINNINNFNLKKNL